ncbi:MAG: hypothetical protein A2268_16320 [Candidatus Raymondbacteria bacterium RifOxyA12_full_50_37]|uniref:Response regulatory domain-containing protein n=1 Tax=Candidatus Raymondbacteria bacterium RIFOXYD12_FULL_49_13 TaxID=1817890 RepID=A0A1F7F7Y3_UNCRA|nr:MAG: hypothetical protein A2268_16320 [Candidatus Raymondbacteria bacterium RifOxyA12_full_50_37]OGJ94363.1 MAG: hypothetical protein A2248_14515 [Candidatus Raymondbacteria bacterium RIFOXYA2_FULL_49_16]OGJ95124.1 MAG: hypothetical protein A2350_09270 [Candidatus Raymondbacteria bacterium RifOxyB12_full_50_8]OGJ95305.1 MAG: hypothetical protein A2453_05940 [Candidatus Raymondbacteria bacterium RIFOXYC2_FULL_50_21]OGJ99808.1 MAG: hypothetical protein A2487_10750 [Candidatus Raymondbacteria b
MKKILIVDDDSAMREVVKTVLAGSYEVQEASGKAQGLGKVKSFNPDLIILDVMMETASAGFDMARELKGDNKHSKIKILMLTNVSMESKMDFSTVAGDPEWLPVDEFLSKPIDPKGLFATVKKLLA